MSTSPQSTAEREALHETPVAGLRMRDWQEGASAGQHCRATGTPALGSGGKARETGASAISALGTSVTVSLEGTGSLLPEPRVGNASILERIRPVRPDGRPIEPEWVDRHLGIHERRLDLDLATMHKRSRAEGGLYDGEMAVRAARSALDDAGVEASEVDILVHVSTTPDTIACSDHLRYITGELALRAGTDLIHHNLGCAGLAAGFRTAASYLVSTAPATALVVASNCVSAYYGEEANDAYQAQGNPGDAMDWLVPVMFADGAGAAVWRGTPTGGGQPAAGLCSVRYETNPDVGLVTYPGGGGINHTTRHNIRDHRFYMDARRVSEEFGPLILRDMQMLEEDWPTHIKPAVRRDFDPEAVTRWYMHQANGVVVRKATELLGLPPERVPIGVDHYGNTSAASTLILLDEDRRAGRLHDGDLVVFLWVGAGNGAMNGYAALVV